MKTDKNRLILWLCHTGFNCFATTAIGAIAGKPEIPGRILIGIGLAEGIAIDGLIVTIPISSQIAKRSLDQDVCR